MKAAIEHRLHDSNRDAVVCKSSKIAACTDSPGGLSGVRLPRGISVPEGGTWLSPGWPWVAEGVGVSPKSGVPTGGCAVCTGAADL